MIETLGLLHIGMPVVSTKDAIRWYVDNMGFELAYETVYRGHEIAENVAFVRKGDVMLELYEFPWRPSARGGHSLAQAD